MGSLCSPTSYCSRYLSRAFLGMSNDLFAQLAQQQCILPSPLCTSGRWKLLPHIRMMVCQPSAPLRCLIAGWNNPASQLLLKGKETFWDLQGSSGIFRSRVLHCMMHPMIAFLPHLQSSSSAASKLTHPNRVCIWLWNFCREEWIPMDLHHELAPGSSHPNTMSM